MQLHQWLKHWAIIICNRSSHQRVMIPTIEISSIIPRAIHSESRSATRKRHRTTTSTTKCSSNLRTSSSLWLLLVKSIRRRPHLRSHWLWMIPAKQTLVAGGYYWMMLVRMIAMRYTPAAKGRSSQHHPSNQTRWVHILWRVTRYAKHIISCGSCITAARTSVGHHLCSRRSSIRTISSTPLILVLLILLVNYLVIFIIRFRGFFWLLLIASSFLSFLVEKANSLIGEFLRWVDQATVGSIMLTCMKNCLLLTIARRGLSMLLLLLLVLILFI